MTDNTDVLNGITDDLQDLHSDVRDLQERVASLVASPLCCAECVGQNQLAQRRGTPEHELPQINAAFMVVNGLSVCPDHVQFNSPLLAP